METSMRDIFTARFQPRSIIENPSEDSIQALRQALKHERLAWLSQFEGLDPDIVSALKP
jgi:hypothetical protein